MIQNKPLINWTHIYEIMGWDNKHLQSVPTGKEIDFSQISDIKSDRKRLEIIDFIQTASLEELKSLIDHLEQSGRQSYEGMINHLKHRVELMQSNEKIPL